MLIIKRQHFWAKAEQSGTICPIYRKDNYVNVPRLQSFLSGFSSAHQH